ncbi:N-acetylmuramoyl-L-alanine amidase [Agriterribacter sp.]|uniref:N-acetylmuramoyl-L-alanine amidase n=1 Tax=Agriterribacter sp. TaxID=2821509 RepID=UPI002BEC3FF4|nr:N-acetylmuramoyl-L-alanine amidase [Agriterribacter sp.]HTN05386.1 N-acetylmuramoyl-L-alanine amidase [Agriterribacter sp.]
MRFTALINLEENLLHTGNNGEYTLAKIAIPVKGEDIILNGMLTTPKNRSKYYYAVEHPKQRIVLHFTAGQLRSDLSALTRDNYHVSVAFVIGRDGTVYQLFSSKYWSGHLGKGIGNTNTGNAQDKCTIGIEISNYGYLTERNGNLETYYSRQKNAEGQEGPVDVYCSLTEKQAWLKTGSPFRGQSYYAAYTNEQMESVVILLRYLTAQYNIPRVFLPEPERYQATEAVLSFKGIVSHINYRPTGKWDIGPAFHWDKVITNVQAPVFEPQYIKAENMPAARGMRGDADMPLRSEEQLDALLPEPIDASFENEPYEELPHLDK